MKKWLTLLLLLVCITATFYPCCMHDDCCIGNKTEGTCSPLFACATCPCSVELAKPIQLTEPIIEKVVYHQAIEQFNLPAYSSSFWQPPRSC